MSSASFAAVVLAVYSKTLHNGCSGGDAGELMAMACSGGVPHPPGYPLLMVLGRIWLALCPEVWGSPASRLGLLSAILGAATCSIVSSTVSLCCRGRRWDGILAGGLWSFSPLTWKFSTQFEVFALNNLLCAALLYLTIRHLVDRASWIPYFGAFLSGLALTNQHTSVLLLVPLIIAVVADAPRLLRPGSLLLLLLLFLLGLTPYAYLPLAGAQPPLGSWGAVDSREGFVKHLLRREYGTFQLYTSGNQPNASMTDGQVRFWGHTWRYLAAFARDTFYLGPALAALGIVSLARRGKQWLKVAATTVAGLCLYLGVFHSLANLPDQAFFQPIHDRFWMQPNLLFLLAAGAGAGAVSDFLDPPSQPPGPESHAGDKGDTGAAVSDGDTTAQSAAATNADTSADVGKLGPKSRRRQDGEWSLVSYCRGAVAVLAIAAQVANNWQSPDEVVDQLARDMMRAVPERGVALSSGDLNYFPLLYLQGCEGMRRDVTIMNTAMMKGTWYQDKQGPLLNVTLPGKLYEPALQTEWCGPGVYNIACLLRANPPAWTATNVTRSARRRKGGKARSGSNRPVVVVRKWPPGDESAVKDYELWPRGLLSQVMLPSKVPTGSFFDQWLSESLGSLPPLPEGASDAVDAHRSWESIAKLDYIASYTALSKFLIAALRDNHVRYGIATNQLALVEAALNVSQRVVQVLPNEPTSYKNLGALHQHLMNHPPGDEAQSKLRQRQHMESMVKAYRGFLRVAEEANTTDPDRKILGDWVVQVEAWMAANTPPGEG